MAAAGDARDPRAGPARRSCATSSSRSRRSPRRSSTRSWRSRRGSPRRRSDHGHHDRHRGGVRRPRRRVPRRPRPGPAHGPRDRTDAHEGPVYVADEHALYFTTVPRPGAGDRRRHPAPRPGHAAAHHVRARRERRQRHGARRATAACSSASRAASTRRRGSRSSTARPARPDRRRRVRRAAAELPNDVVVKRDGTVWFTDPSYGHLQGFRPAPALGDEVYRFDPASRSVALVADGFDKPNGLAFSPDERTLYVGDSGANHEPGDYDPDRPRHVLAFDVLDHGGLADARVFAVGSPGSRTASRSTRRAASTSRAARRPGLRPDGEPARRDRACPAP